MTFKQLLQEINKLSDDELNLDVSLERENGKTIFVRGLQRTVAEHNWETGFVNKIVPFNEDGYPCLV